MSFKSILTSTRPISLQSHSKEKQINQFCQSVTRILETEKENMPIVIGESNGFAIRNHNSNQPLPVGTTVDKRHIQWLTFKLKQGFNPCEGPVDQSEISIWI